jgi:hypothetical protein
MRVATTVEIETLPDARVPAAREAGSTLRFSHADFHEPTTPLCEHELAPRAPEPRELARTLAAPSAL